MSVLCISAKCWSLAANSLLKLLVLGRRPNTLNFLASNLSTPHYALFKSGARTPNDLTAPGLQQPRTPHPNHPPRLPSPSGPFQPYKSCLRLLPQQRRLLSPPPIRKSTTTNPRPTRRRSRPQRLHPHHAPNTQPPVSFIPSRNSNRRFPLTIRPSHNRHRIRKTLLPRRPHRLIHRLFKRHTPLQTTASPQPSS